MMDINALKFSVKNIMQQESEKQDINDNRIAIIGMDAKLGSAENLQQFWDGICQGEDFIDELPAYRWKDADKLCKLKFGKNLSEDSGQAAYLNRIDLFDANFFNISSTEAEVMDPAQRIFMESAWCAIEDAGYGGKRLDGTQTGVYVGYSTIGEQYVSAIEEDPNTYSVVMSGNINSIIASRISYCLNLKGPAVVVDTACSSSLTALHLACKQLRVGEISMALVGGIHIALLPKQPTKNKMGIESTSQRTKTFDDNADGTGGGEGVVSILLKPLQEAVQDGDNIYAVIRGSSINQDGTSVGITAPNAESQAEVIRSAWRDSNVNPEAISYIEAHGTATNLGDPAEITGIENAFRQYTDKTQFCAIGSCKSNIGHLDCVCGLAGVVKTVMMLKYKIVPPSIHFKVPNKKIDFVSSPVYVNDMLRAWDTDGKRICGVSSFGLSGTNCHVVLEEITEESRKKSTHEVPRIITASAKTKSGVLLLLKNYQEYLSKTNCDLDDFCYTANTGRGHYTCRFALMVKDKEEFIHLNVGELVEEKAFYMEHKVADSNDTTKYITPERKKQITKAASECIRKLILVSEGVTDYKKMLSSVVQYYLQGAEVEWMELYKNDTFYKLSIPKYPFSHKRYWFKDVSKNTEKENVIQQKLHPLIDSCLVKTKGICVYETVMSMDRQWELYEHRVHGKGVLPGTAYIEMVHYVYNEYFGSDSFEICSLIYLLPLSCQEKEKRLLHTILTKENDYIHVLFCSRDYENENDEWISHAELKVNAGNKRKQSEIDIKAIIKRCKEVKQVDEKNVNIVNIGGLHWSDNLRHGYANDNEIVLDMQLSDKLIEEAQNYYMIPSMLDQAISSGHYFSKDVYIPFYSEKLSFYEKLPVNLYSYIKKKAEEFGKDELKTFDITLCDENGMVIAEIENYVIKKIDKPEFFLVTQRLAKNMFYETKWVVCKDILSKSYELEVAKKNTLVLVREEQLKEKMYQQIVEKYKEKLITVIIGSQYKKVSNKEYYIGLSQQDFDRLLGELKIIGFDDVIHMISYGAKEVKNNLELRQIVQETLKSNFLFTKAILNNDIRDNIHVLCVTKNGTSVTGLEKELNPFGKMLLAMGLCLTDEYSNIKTRGIDLDEFGDINDICRELQYSDSKYEVAYRNKERYLEEINQIAYKEEYLSKAIILKPKGVYVIAGGLGGMGLSFCNYMLNIEPTISVILLNRSYTEEELMFCQNHIKGKADKINALRAEGKIIKVVKTDISDYEQLESTLSYIRKMYGTIDGVINAAGVASDGFIMNKEWNQFEEVIRPKVDGSWNLYKLIKQDNPDFLILCSSFASVFGAVGQIDYTSANAFLDSFTYYCNKNGLPTLTINWTGWNESGMAVDNNVMEKGGFLHFLSDAEGAVALSYAMNTGLKRVLAGEMDFAALGTMEEQLKGKIAFSPKIEEKIKVYSDINISENDISHIVISGTSMEELGEIERDIILVWSQILGTTEVDIHDRFFEVGGNSLLASYFQKEIDKKYPGVVSITDIFMYSTIEQMSQYISNKLYGKKKVEKETIVIEESNGEQSIEDMVAQFVKGNINAYDFEELL